MKRALVRTVGGTKHARSVCLSFPRPGHTPTPSARRPDGIERCACACQRRHGDSVEARTAQPVVLKQGGRFMEIAAAVFEGGSRATHLGDESFEQLGNRVPVQESPTATPTRGHGPEREPPNELMMMGIQGQHRDHLARTQPDAAINHPDEAVGKGA